MGNSFNFLFKNKLIHPYSFIGTQPDHDSYRTILQTSQPILRTILQGKGQPLTINGTPITEENLLNKLTRYKAPHTYRATTRTTERAKVYRTPQPLPPHNPLAPHHEPTAEERLSQALQHTEYENFSLFQDKSYRHSRMGQMQSILFYSLNIPPEIQETILEHLPPAVLSFPHLLEKFLRVVFSDKFHSPQNLSLKDTITLSLCFQKHTESPLILQNSEEASQQNIESRSTCRKRRTPILFLPSPDSLSRGYHDCSLPLSTL